MNDLRGVTIAQYRILRELESGGMGTVYKAEDTRLKRMVVLKFLPDRSFLDTAAKERFIREARLASALDHANICTIYEFNKTIDGKFYLVMPYYQGVALASLIQEGPVEPDRIINIVRQIATGLACAHASGIIHRDLKPANILVLPDDQIKILDFGLAKINSEASSDTQFESAGTAHYMSPEQISGEGTDARTDIWSLGVIIYEMLTGEPPFKGEYIQTISYSILNDDPILPATENGSETKLMSIILRALQKKPDDRYTNMQELLDDLTGTDQPAAQESSTPEPKTSESLAGKSLISYRTGLAAAIVVFVLALTLFFWPQNDGITVPVLTILPFSEESGHASGTRFSDGIVEELIVRLGRIPDISVRPWEFTRQLKYNAQSVPDIYQNMGGRYYLSGKLISGESDIQIDVNIYDAGEDQVVWNGRFHRTYKEIFLLMDEIIDQAAIALLSGKKSVRESVIATELTPDIMAYDYYLRGREKYYQYTAAANEEAIDLFRQSLAIDPDFVRSQAGLADAYTQKTLRYGSETMWLDSALNRAITARNGTSSDAEAYKAEGLVYYSRSWLSKSIEANRKALAVNAGFVPAMANLAWSLIHTGKLGEAMPLLQRAQILYPTNPSISIGIGFIDLIHGEYTESEKWLRHAYNFQKDHRPNPMVLLEILRELRDDTTSVFQEGMNLGSDAGLYLAAGNACLVMGKPDCAIEYYSQALVLDPAAWHPFTGINATTSLGFILWKTDRRDEADLMFKHSLEQNENNILQGSEWWGVDYDQAAIHCIRGETKQALAHLKTAVDKGFRIYHWLEIDPLFENLRGNPAFFDLLSSIDRMRKEDL